MEVEVASEGADTMEGGIGGKVWFHCVGKSKLRRDNSF